MAGGGSAVAGRATATAPPRSPITPLHGSPTGLAAAAAAAASPESALGATGATTCSGTVHTAVPTSTAAFVPVSPAGLGALAAPEEVAACGVTPTAAADDRPPPAPQPSAAAPVAPSVVEEESTSILSLAAAATAAGDYPPLAPAPSTAAPVTTLVSEGANTPVQPPAVPHPLPFLPASRVTVAFPDSASAWEDCLATFVSGAVWDGLGLGRAAVVASHPVGVAVWAAGDGGGSPRVMSVGGGDRVRVGEAGWLWLRLQVDGGGKRG